MEQVQEAGQVQEVEHIERGKRREMHTRWIHAVLLSIDDDESVAHVLGSPNLCEFTCYMIRWE